MSMHELDGLDEWLESQVEPLCVGCGKRPEQIEEYREAAREDDVSPNEYVRREEGTYNSHNGHFLCTSCYVKAGCPSGPRGWRAP